jgi:hypothetical protein
MLLKERQTRVSFKPFTVPDTSIKRRKGDEMKEK